MSHLHKSLAAYAIELIKISRESQQRVDVPGQKNVVILAQFDGALHGGVVVTRVELLLRQHLVVVGGCTSPGVSCQRCECVVSLV